MEVNRHLILSAVFHVVLISAALALAGGGAMVRVPARVVSVFLLAESLSVPAAMETRERRQDEKHGFPSKTLPVVAPSPLPLPPEPHVSPIKKEVVPTAVKLKGKSDAVEVRSPGHDAGLAMPARAPVQDDSGVSRSGNGLTNLPGWPDGEEYETTATAMSRGRRDASAGPAYDAGVEVIRASIERAKRYPLIAKRRGMEGTATVEFTINGHGVPKDIRIARTSGWEILDAAAMETISRAAPYPVIGARIEIPITFRLRQAR